jgi:hypothetical protein
MIAAVQQLGVRSKNPRPTAGFRVSQCRSEAGARLVHALEDRDGRESVSASAGWTVSRTCACSSATKTGAASSNDLLCRVIVGLPLKAYR